MKVKKILIILVIILFGFSISQVVYGASATLTASSTTIETGKTATITVKADNAASWNLNLTSNGGNLSIASKIALAGTSSTGENCNDTITTATFSAETAGEYTITLSGQAVDFDETSSKVNKTCTITVKAPEQKPAEEPKEEKPKEEKPVEQPKEETPAKSSNNRLAGLGIKPLEYDFSNFKKNNEKVNRTYYATVPYEVSEIQVYAKKQEASQTISGTGTFKVKVGSDNQFQVKCTAEDGTTMTYIIKVTREEEKPQETAKTLEEPTNEEQQPEEKTDDNQEQTEDKVLGITKLNITAKTEKEETIAVELNPAFNENTYEYMIAVPLTVKDLEITAETADGKAELEVMGNKNLVEGENIVTVIAKVGEETKIYQITVTKTAQVTSSALSNEIIIQLAIIAAIATIIIVAIAAIIIMIVKSKKKDKVKSKKSTIDIDIGEMPNDTTDNNEDKK